MAIKLADTLAPMSEFPAAMAEHIGFSDGATLQEKFDNKELGGGDSSVTLTQEEYEALSEEQKLDGLYYTYDTKRIYKNGVQYGASEPIPLTMEEYKALKEAGAIDEQQEYLIEADEQGILLEASDIGYSNAVSNLPCTTVQGAIDKVVEKVDSEISSNLENCFLNTGIIISNESDIKSVDDAPIGICFVSKDAVDNPFTFWSTIFTIGYNNNKYEQQLAFPWARNEATMMKFRVKDNGVWNDWKTISLS